MQGVVALDVDLLVGLADPVEDGAGVVAEVAAGPGEEGDAGQGCGIGLTLNPSPPTPSSSRPSSVAGVRHMITASSPLSW